MAVHNIAAAERSSVHLEPHSHMLRVLCTDTVTYAGWLCWLLQLLGEIQSLRGGWSNQLVFMSGNISSNGIKRTRELVNSSKQQQQQQHYD